jgi:hypothetical protein
MTLIQREINDITNRKRENTDKCRRKRDPPCVAKGFGTARYRPFSRILPIAIRTYEVVLDLLF